MDGSDNLRQVGKNSTTLFTMASLQSSVFVFLTTVGAA